VVLQNNRPPNPDDPETRPGQARPVTLYDRMKRVIAMHPGWTTRHWARAAGLAEESHVYTIMQRLRRNPEATVSVRTLAALAEGADVPFEWLSTGKGDPRSTWIRIDPDPMYPTRAQAIVAARLLGWDSRAIAKVSSVSNLPTDPGLDYWRRLIEAQHVALPRDALTGPLPIAIRADGSGPHTGRRKTR